ncbi:MAG: TIGR04283 family arsenosugar biosynthesis glycosyltransferase [Desulforhopalus sp.]
MAMISVIIPALNEKRSLPRTLAVLVGHPGTEIIIVDGGSDDGTPAVAERCGCKIYTGPRNRSQQMNIGAENSSGDILLFLHADTLLPDNFPQAVHRALGAENVAAGAFSLSFDNAARSLRCIAWGANLRSRIFQLPYGDQGIFTSRARFDAVGGFPEMEIMEDFVFIREMQRMGRIVTVAEKVTTSARRWQSIGIIKTTLINQLIICGHSLGVSHGTLAHWYRRARGTATIPTDSDG